ncbi:hypothetical protein AAEZ94_001119 [Providencia rettgeri]|nr:hypothetical protein [Providencia rettgeri]EIU9514277.1 hypothetical protein [Providencia rettgeri]ELR5093798.1 hypothetical protein [Providencia rettgeri]
MQDLMPPINTPDSAFHDGDPTTGQLGTIVTALWLNNVQSATRDVQLEIKNVLAKAGIQPDPKKTNQLAEAISQIIGSGNYASTAYVDNGLNKKIDKANISGQKGNDNDKVPSLNLFTTEIGKLAAIGYSYSKIESDGRYQPKGNYAPAGDYATNAALKNGLDGKFDKTGGKLLGGIAATGISAEKIDSNHRASIYPPIDDNENSLAYFQYNLGSSWFGRVLIPKAPSGQTISLLSSENIVQVTGNSTANIISQKGVTDLANAKLDKSSVVQSVGTSETNVISQKALTNALIGFNQKFEDLKSQREKNVLYTNTTGKPIFITVSVFTTSVVTGIGITLYIDNVKFLTRGGGSANDGTYKGTSATAIIPPGSSYKIESSGEIDSWGELR